jgi:hypothetical protein
MKNKLWVIIVVAYLAVSASPQQVSDTAFRPAYPKPDVQNGSWPGRFSRRSSF